MNLKHSKCKTIASKSGPGPTLTFQEAAKEFGIPLESLRGYMQHHKPSPEIVCKAQGKTYYNAAEIRTWWKKLQKEKKCV
mgnify:CR=1 FL=1